MARFLNQFGNLPLLHGRETGILSWEDLAGIRGILGKSFLVQKGIVLGVSALCRLVFFL